MADCTKAAPGPPATPEVAPTQTHMPQVWVAGSRGVHSRIEIESSESGTPPQRVAMRQRNAVNRNVERRPIPRCVCNFWRWAIPAADPRNEGVLDFETWTVLSVAPEVHAIRDAGHPDCGRAKQAQDLPMLAARLDGEGTGHNDEACIQVDHGSV